MNGKICRRTGRQAEWQTSIQAGRLAHIHTYTHAYTDTHIERQAGRYFVWQIDRPANTQAYRSNS